MAGRIGRPPKPEAEKKRHNLTLRIRDQTRTRLADLAERSGRSLSEEVEYLIERSFDRAALLAEVRAAIAATVMED